jgi:geranylgeranyl reductase family protein
MRLATISTRQDFDAIVIGGGPAGALTAYRLSLAGLRVLIVEARTFPREKACGGGIQYRAFDKLPVECHSVVHAELREVSFTFAMKAGFTRQCQGNLVSSVLRTEFDDLLLTLAASAGATVWQGCKALAVTEETAFRVTVRTSLGDVTARYAVGADGANGMVASYLNRRDAYFWQIALYCEIPGEFLRADSVNPTTMRIDWGTLPSGYGWIFPKGGAVNVGVGGPVPVGKVLRSYLTNFMQKEQILRPGMLSKLKFRGHPLPTLTARTKLSSSCVVLVGDAAGLVEPLTGEGISNACHSADIAAKYILESLDRSGDLVESYERRIRNEIGREIRLARQLLSFAAAFPQVLFKRIRTDDLVWEVFCQVLRGEDSFLALRRVILGRFDTLSIPLQYFSSWRETMKLRRGLCDLPDLM